MHSSLLSRNGSPDANENIYQQTETRDLSLKDGQYPELPLHVQNLAADDAHKLGSFYLFTEKMCEKPTCCNWTCFMLFCFPVLFVLIYCLVALILLWPTQPKIEAMYFRPYTAQPYIRWKAHKPVVFLNLSGGFKTELRSYLGADVDAMNVVFHPIFPDWAGNKVRSGKLWTERKKRYKIRPKSKSNLTYWIEMQTIPESVLAQVLYEEMNKSMHFGFQGYGLLLIDFVFVKATVYSDCWFKMNGSIAEENDWIPKPPKAHELYYNDYDNCLDNDVALATPKVDDTLQRGEAQQYVDSGMLKKNPFDITENLMNHTFKLKVVSQTCHYSINNFEFWSN